MEDPTFALAVITCCNSNCACEDCLFSVDVGIVLSSRDIIDALGVLFAVPRHAGTRPLVACLQLGPGRFGPASFRVIVHLCAVQALRWTAFVVGRDLCCRVPRRICAAHTETAKVCLDLRAAKDGRAHATRLQHMET